MNAVVRTHIPIGKICLALSHIVLGLIRATFCKKKKKKMFFGKKELFKNLFSLILDLIDPIFSVVADPF